MYPGVGAMLAMVTVVVIRAVIHIPLGTWIHRVLGSEHHTRLERAIYRVVGVDANSEQRWSGYATSALAFPPGQGTDRPTERCAA